jgi:hypothetical protein
LSQDRFLQLKSEWKAGTAMHSSIARIVIHPAYQQIIGMGEPAIQFILLEMKEKPDHWFWALQAITGENPVLPEWQGRMREMTAAWLRWGRERGCFTV